MGMNDINSLSHTKWNCKYHIVFAPKYRRKVFYKAKRAAALYSEDESKALRVSHKNPQIIELYANYLGEPNSHKAHELLHTSYTAKEKFSK